MTIIASRAIVALFLLTLVILIRDRSLFRISGKDLPLLALIGVTGFFLLNICFNISVSTLSLSLASLLLGTAPVFVILFGRILFGEKITRVKIFCMLVALAGCVLLSGVVESGGLKWSIFALRYVDSGVASILSSGAEPTSAMLFGLLFYNEVPTVLGVIGMVMTITAIAFLIRSE